MKNPKLFVVLLVILGSLGLIFFLFDKKVNH